jgi:hypothetical protein
MATGAILLSPTGKYKLSAAGKIMLSDGAGNACCCDCPNPLHVAPVRQCGTGTLVKLGGVQVYAFCMEGDTTVHTYYSTAFHQCLYYDCAEAIDVCEDVQLDTGFTVTDCDADECNTGPGEPCDVCDPGTTPGAVLVTLSGLVTDSCCDTTSASGVGSFKIVGSLDVTVFCTQNPGDPCGYSGVVSTSAVFHSYTDAACTVEPGTPVPLSVRVSVGRGAMGWSVDAEMLDSSTSSPLSYIFIGSVAAAAGNCTNSAVATNTLIACDAATLFNYTGGGTATITPL